MQPGHSFIDIINEQLTSKNVKLPAFDPTAMRIQQEISKEDPDVRLIEKLIISDQALTGEVLRVSNSSFYRGLTEVYTVRDAIIRLGVREISNIVTLVAMQHHFRSKDPGMRKVMENLWRHSVGCAIGANWLAKHAGFQSVSHEAFIAGLLHDVGKLFILKVIDDLKHLAQIDQEPSDPVIDEAMTRFHTEHGYTLMCHWNLPARYSQVARDHHNQQVDSHDSLLLLVRLADQACNKMGIGLKEDPDIDLMASTEAKMLLLSEVDLAQLEVRLEDSKVFSSR